MSYNVQIKKVAAEITFDLPKKMTSLASGYDLIAAINSPLTIQPGERVLVPSGIAISMPNNLEAQVRPRSGLAYKHGITALNSPGTIDADYRGEIKVLLINHSKEEFIIQPKDRIAQLVFQEIPEIQLIEVEELTDTERGVGGFGHTGVKAEN
ncbi:dUTP diphosphatase [Chengkuizengella axinellae]|uniref:Deoxyuridine 5'-triphosphate nucleotidohydrolase n=1 Tax=Chengkuizengella axinellae TaxID=3064388 RepID=A0ABT9IVZ1_9BACL|nr:dUTP diphosphatase [Chengkuizengella sp. 2205SS18-9]MDP5273492.1 dUTP diphosphatase [Chengkuizengella sp. 2205SS18-9]